MITRRYMSSWRHLNLYRGRFVVTLAYVALITVIHELGWAGLEVPVAMAGILGTALSILLGFRTNSAYDRWWEARRVWGGIVNDSRSFARQVLTLFEAPPDSPAAQEQMTALQMELIYRQIAWNYALSRDLRGQDPAPALQGLLPPAEIDALATQDNPHAAILQTQGERLRSARDERFLNDVLYLPVEGTLTRFSDHMGMCERIKSTTFPTQYTFFVRRIAWLFILLLPLGLTAHLGWLTIPAAYLIGFVFLMIDTVAEYLQDPFENRPTDTPMTAICRVIEINLRQQLGETELPPKLQPVDGVLM